MSLPKSLTPVAFFLSPVTLTMFVLRALTGLGSVLSSFNSAKQEAVRTGKSLALLIRNRQILNKSSVSLLGFSLGAQVVASCLEQLAEWDLKVVQDVILLGAAMPKSASLLNARSASYGRFINVYSKSDYILKLLFSLSTLTQAVGLGPLELGNTENYDVSAYGGHTDYRIHLGEILELIDYSP